MTNEYFKNQLSIFDLIETEEAPKFPESDFAEIVDYINKKLGLNFQRRDGILEKTSSDDPEPSNYYEAKLKKKVTLSLSKGKFYPDVYDGAYYIGVGYSTPTAGRSAPVDTIEQAIDFFKRNIEDDFSPYSKHK